MTFRKHLSFYRTMLGSRNTQATASHVSHILPALVVGLLGLTLSFLAWSVFFHLENRQATLEFNSRAESHTLILQRGLNEYVDDVEAIRALFESSDRGVTRSEFGRFADNVLQGQAAISSVAWLPRVKREARVEHEAEAIRDGVPEYSIKTTTPDGKFINALDRDEYFPVYYRLEKEHVGEFYAYGVDQNADAMRRKTLEQARDGNHLAISEDIKLRYGGGTGFFGVLPVYRQGEPHDTVEDRRNNLDGFIRATFETSVMIETILTTTTKPAGLDLYFFDPKSARDAPPAFFHSSRQYENTNKPLQRAVLDAGLNWYGSISIGDRQFIVVAARTAGGLGSTSHIGAWMVLVGCLLISGIVATYFWSSGRHALRLISANAELDKTVEALGASSQQLTTQNMRFDAALNNMLQGLVMFDADERIVVCNSRFIEMFGLTRDVVKPGCSLRELRRNMVDVGNPIMSPGPLKTEVNPHEKQQTLKLADGREISISRIPMPQGGWVATHEDITERRKAEARIAHMSLHDALTNLPNRLFFRETMEGRLARMDRDQKFAVLCLDLDQFKAVNDTLGHPFGDELLRQVGARLRACLREGDTLARLGGDEFAILQGNPGQPADTVSLMSRIIEVISKPFDLHGHQVVIGVSVGAAVAPTDGTDPELLLKSADMALYRAKIDGRGLYRFFEPEMDARIQSRRAMELDMRKALANGEFELYYQPLVSLETDTITSFEALIRWNHPERGMISPADFIPLAEETALIVPIGEWVLRQACAEAAKWPSDIGVAVNLSPAQFKSPHLSQIVITALARSGLSPLRLELEITESVLLFNNDNTLATLHQLRALGVRIAMDDFGTGYSSLSYLRSFPFDKIKIDQSFVHNLSDDEDSKAIIRAVTGLGTSLRMTTTGEGVETQEELDYLRNEGCTEAQGYFFSKPRPANEIPALLAKQFVAAKAVA
jgi:diguanylate cyclase (GGDEF)-like protein/PAS domain S-box-containing protein